MSGGVTGPSTGSRKPGLACGLGRERDVLDPARDLAFCGDESVDLGCDVRLRIGEVALTVDPAVESSSSPS